MKAGLEREDGPGYGGRQGMFMAVARRRTRGKAKRRAPAARRSRRWLRWPFRIAFWLLLAILLWVALYRVVPVPGGFYMAREAVRLGGIERDWQGFDAISPHLARAVMAAEDARFCDHWGFDFDAIRAAIEERGRGRFRGASTISQQVAKNVFLWHEGRWLRKGLEAGFTGLIELIWSKRRILEVYLNVAEFAPGVFGAEAAARHHFGRGAGELTAGQAALLAAVLPNPKKRSASDPSEYVQRRARAIGRGAATLRAEGRDACVF
ncbi:MAG TPA: monofunctional biosynthetic peptidoglycan transglycosylase [Paracoccaceae bacterium]|nr:monofunctional biosynthetic peptidoglycan transglycosylase [Paracoccaceae bacterium]